MFHPNGKIRTLAPSHPRTLAPSHPLSDNSTRKTVQGSAPKRRGVLPAHAISRCFRTMAALSAAVFLFHACDMSASPPPPPYKLTQDKGGTNRTLKIDEGVTIIRAGEYAAVPSIGSGADRKTFNTRITRHTLGLKTDGEVRTAVTAIILPSTLETIEEYAFYGHSAVKGTLIIPDKVQSIGAQAFGGTGTDLTVDIKDDSKLENTVGAAAAFDIANIKTIRAPRFTLTRNADNATYTLAVAEGVTTVEKGEFSSKKSGGGWGGTPKTTLNTRLKGALLGTDPRYAITAITLPSTLEVIEDYAFYRNDIIQGTLTIPKKVQSIGRDAFSSVFHTERTSPLTLTFEDESQLRTIGKDAFRHRRISVLNPLPERLEVIGYGAFSNTPITTASFIIPRNVTRIGAFAFAYDDDKITGTLTIESPHLARTPDDKAQEKTGALGDHLFVYYLRSGGIAASNFSTIKLHEAVYDSYTQDELTQIFGTGTRGKYQDLDGSALPAKP